MKGNQSRGKCGECRHTRTPGTEECQMTVSTGNCEKEQGTLVWLRRLKDLERFRGGLASVMPTYYALSQGEINAAYYVKVHGLKFNRTPHMAASDLTLHASDRQNPKPDAGGKIEIGPLAKDALSQFQYPYPIPISNTPTPPSTPKTPTPHPKTPPHPPRAGGGRGARGGRGWVLGWGGGVFGA